MNWGWVGTRLERFIGRVEEEREGRDSWNLGGFGGQCGTFLESMKVTLGKTQNNGG